MNILVVDDEIKICQILQEILEDMGHKVYIADRGEDALDIASFKFIDLMFLDIKMPDICGEKVLQEIRKRGNNIKVIILSGIDNELVKNFVKELGACSYITKPYTIDQLEKHIKAAVEHAA